MNILEIHVDDFGAWHQLTLDGLGPGATVFYGPNEAGKTTLLNLIRTVLYGFSNRRCHRYLPPALGNQAGGALSVSDLSGRYRIQRTATSHYQGGPGTLRIQSDRGDAFGNELLTTLLAGVDETVFNNVFAVGLTQMQQLSTLSDTEAADQLYGLATGVDRVSLFDVTRALESQREALLSTDANATGRIDALQEQKSRLEKELKALQRDSGHFAKLRREYRQLRDEIKQKEATKKLLDANGDWPEISATIRKKWSRCRELDDRLRRIGPVADMPKHIATRVAQTVKQLAGRRQEWLAIRDERRQLKAKADKLKGRDNLYSHAAEIEAIDRQRPRILSLEEGVKRCQSTVDELEFEIQAEMEELGLQTGTSAKSLPPISDEVIEALRVPAREAREQRESVDAFKRIAESCRKEAETVKGKLETASLRYGGEGIDAALDRGVKLTQDLERRLDLDEHRESIVRKLDELQDEVGYWQRRTVLPWRGVLIMCAVFSVGAMLLLTGLLINWFDLAETIRLPMMLIGGSLAVVSLVIKGAFENSARERTEFCRKQLGLLHEEQERAQAESAELDQALPTGSGPLDQRLLDARQELAKLDQFIPLRNRCQELTREAEAAEHQATLAVRQLKEARRTWKASLRAVGLPDSLTPAQIGQMTGKVGDVTRLRNRLNESRLEVEDRRKELTTIRDRLEQLLTIAEIHDVPDGLGPQLTRLLAELEKHAKTGKQRAHLRERWGELKQKQDQIARVAKQLIETRRQLLAAHGITSTSDFRNTISRGKKAEAMRQERDDLLGQIKEVVGDEFPIKKLEKLLDRRSHALLEHLTTIDENRLSIGADLNSLYERCGELKQKLDGHMNDRRRERKELEIRTIDERVVAAMHDWHRSALASAALDSVKENYETKRQPVALAEASRHLERLTEGRYTRIWTPMGQNSLCVDDSSRHALPVEKLSRGTRELVYLALRLALVSSYNRRGANMPIVLDDVFVNFDDQRARAAVSVLVDVAQGGQQILIFTCHKRIQQIFSELECDVRDLPERSAVAKRVDPTELSDVEPTVAEPTVPEPTVPESTVASVASLPQTRESDLPVYDAESWDEAVEMLALPIMAAKSVVEEKADPPVPVELESSQPTLQPSVDQFHPTWRDEWLEPLPDLAPAEEEDG